MDKIQNDFVLPMLDLATDCTLATMRPDGYPQATTVSFAHDGVRLCVGIGRNSRNVANIRARNRVPLTMSCFTATGPGSWEAKSPSRGSGRK